MAANTSENSLLARQARELFTEQAIEGLTDLCKLLIERLSALQAQPGSAREVQERREALQDFEPASAAWVAGTSAAWKKAQAAASAVPLAAAASSASAALPLDIGKFELMDNEVMETRILASRFALRLLDFSSWELNDLRLRIQNLEGSSELQKEDVFRPEVLARHLVDQWTKARLSRGLWILLQDLIQSRLSEHLLEAYHTTNAFLVRQGVMAEIDLRPLVKRTPSAVSDKKGPLHKSPGVSPGGFAGSAGATGAPGAGRLGEGLRENGQGGGASARPSTGGGSHYETRAQSAMTPISRARMRAQGVMSHLKRLLLSQQVPELSAARGQQASAPLAHALSSILMVDEVERTALAGLPAPVYGSVHVEQASTALRQRTSTLKQAASSSTEKATIEIVALMFQSILAEDRIPPTVRVWFARLQMPVLRVAIAEPEFFDSLQHPARRLIDRMGSCVLGFDVAVSGGAMEAEIKRVVQVIEQYPETGRRVFQLVYDEFQKFLSKFLSEQGSAARVVSVAQQIEQKETMTIQYTIEMRSMLNDMPVRDEIREFLFKVWAEVLAIAAMRNGPQHQQTINLKRAAADLVWAASAKPNRVDRTKVIADLPKLLQWLRLGMSMLGLDVKTQDQHIKAISDTLADAFMSKTDAISSDRIDAMAKRLANLEDYLSDEDVGDLPLDTESLVMMIGIDASDIEVITDGGSQPGEEMRAWAQELQLGAWFSLDHNGRVSHVQFAWRSDRKQLHLFASADGRNFLVQARRLAAYLQAGLLVPTEDEALTVRATRDALAKLDANPERLLG